MSTFFSLVHLVALIAFIVFLVKSRKLKKARVDNSSEKKFMLISAAVWFVALILVGVTTPKTDTKEDSKDKAESESIFEKSETTEASDTHIYDTAEIVDLMSGSGTNKIGTFTVAHAKQSDCTEDALSDWYTNYVLQHSDSNFHVIVYDDVADKGVYSTGNGFIQKDTSIIPEDNGTYMLGDDAGSTYYTVSEDGSLKAQISMADASVVDDIKSKVDAVIPDEYKNSDYYAVDIAGEEGSMDCNLTLISETFKDADLQNIAVDLGTKIKAQNLGIGYFCIVFQTDDYTMKAISNMDDLSSQEASEITTKDF